MSETIKMAGREIAPRQLTMSDVRDYLSHMEQQEKLRREWAKYEATLDKLREECGLDDEVVSAPGKPGQAWRLHTMDLLFNDPVTAKAVSLSTGMSMEELEGDYTQQEMRELIDAVRGKNPFLLGMMERLGSR